MNWYRFLAGPTLGGTDIVMRVAFMLSMLSVKSSSAGTSIGVMPDLRFELDPT